MMYKTDVLVVGGGPAGACAAIAAARGGAETMIAEASGMFGGAWTLGLQNHVTSFHDHEKIVIRGIPLEIMKKLSAQGLGEDPEIKFKSSRGEWWVCFDPEGLKILLDTMITGAGAVPLLHALAVGAKVKNNRISEILIAGKGGIEKISAKIVIDCTGDADIAHYSGCETSKGRADGKTQPATTAFMMMGADLEKIRGYVAAEYDRLVKKEEEARKRGEISAPMRISYAGAPTCMPGITYHNTTRILNADATSVKDITRAEIEGRRQAAEIADFYKKNIPGYESARLIMTNASVTFRESRRIKGLSTMTREDVLSARKFDDAVACHAYYIDIHNPDGFGLEKGSDVKAYPAAGSYYQIPYRCMLPEKIGNLIVAGRCVSVSREALGSTRTTACCAALGQAAGIAAAMSLRKGVTPKQISANELRHSLLENDVFLG